jgi:hypothetical protein
MCRSGTGILTGHRWFDAFRLSEGKRLFSNHRATFKQLFGEGDPPRAYDGDLSPDGKALILCEDLAVRVDLATGKRTTVQAPAKLGTFMSARFTADGKRIACTAVNLQDGRDGKAFFVDAADLKVGPTRPVEIIDYVGVTAKGQFIVGGRRADWKDPLPLVDAETGATLATLPGGTGTNDFTHNLNGAFLSRGRRLATLDNLALSVHDLETGKIEARHEFPFGNGDVAIAAGGDVLVSFEKGVGRGKTVELWALKNVARATSP